MTKEQLSYITSAANTTISMMDIDRDTKNQLIHEVRGALDPLTEPMVSIQQSSLSLMLRMITLHSKELGIPEDEKAIILEGITDFLVPKTFSTNVNKVTKSYVKKK